MRLLLLVLIGCVMLGGCDFSPSSFTYETDTIKIPAKTRVSIEGKPALRIKVENIGDTPASNLTIIVKAKKSQKDIQTVAVLIDSLEAHTAIEKVALFDDLRSHDDYDFITIAVRN